MDVLCIGLMVIDIIIKPIDKSVFDVDSSSLETLKVASGGDALNAAINMAKLGMDVGMIGKVGDDILGEYLIREASNHGVDTGMVVKSGQYATSASIVMVDGSGERYFAYYGKTNDNLAIEDIDLSILNKTKITHVGSAMALQKLDGHGIAELFKKARASGSATSMDVTWDSSGKWLDKIEEALKYTDIFLPSYNEAKMISGCEDVIEISKFFMKYGIKILAVKLGSKGCYVTDYKDGYRIKAFEKTKVVDTTGAGDAFVSGFLTGMVKGWNIYNCGLFGNAAASLCISELGATTGSKKYEEILEYIRDSGNGFMQEAAADVTGIDRILRKNTGN